MSIKVLIVEDEEKMARMVELELTHEGYEVSKALDGLSGLEIAESEDFDVILLDIMLPGLSGIEVLRRIRNLKDKKAETPVILLTARDAVVDKVMGLDSGASDYITKPFAIEELLARIRAQARNSVRATGKTSGQEAATPNEDILSSGDLVLDTAARTVKYGAQPIELTLKEFELLACLLEYSGRALSRDFLLEKVWGYDYVGETNAVDVYVRFLRSKIDERFSIKLISTVRGVGYRIDG
ncbi:MAG: response regulator transcription factor [Clostridiales Family XIII bacterium]|jgi:DNA-binding response OmpR family regulator|nr:response regulator transcription factor [Clostridiales Family XIII bacterium]